MAERIRRVKEEVAGVVSIMGSLYLLMSLFTHHIRDSVLFFRTSDPAEPLRNFGGMIGAHISGWLIIMLGLAAFFVPVFFIVFGIRRLLGKKKHRVYFLGGLLCIVSCSVLLALFSTTFHIMFERYPDGIGGLTGRSIAYFADRFFSLPGAYMLSLSGFFASIILLSPVSVASLALRRKRHVPEGGPHYLDDEDEEDPREQEILIREPEPVTFTHPAAPQETREPARPGEYDIPSLTLLNVPDTALSRPSKEDLLNDSALIETKLEDFGVEGKVSKVQPGPIVTMYEFEPAAGVKINRIVSLSDDLALALKAESIRVAPVPGRAVIGIEIPNRQRETVSLREILSAEGFQRSRSKLTLGLGKDIFGAPVLADLSKMPHLLVAGATGSGKSVSINSMVMSILYKATPSEVKMLMIDPKLLELSAYQDIPHLISPVITSPKEAAESLKKMVIEMERRYRILAERASRNIESYNRQVGDDEHLPYIMIIIDELADLMYTAPNDVEDSIARLAQMGRASGMHLILATQRPSVDVITGIIKANFPARISFHVSSKVDSRTILDAHGAEQLLGKGDMLLLLPGTRIMRVHGALVTEEETMAVTEFIKSQGSPDFTIIENIVHHMETLGDDERASERDELYQKAVGLGEAAGEISISSIQRRLKIGYNRAARIMELLEDDGLVGPQRGAGKPRDFLGRRR
jgi:S-DNA-T family DNA segregation ATPase FtsK/SpoIIIE